MEKYTLMGVAGEGQYGTVYRAQLKGSKHLVAIKKFKGQEDEATRREIDLLGQLHHPNIVTLRETFRVHGKLHIVFEYVPQDMLAVLGAFPSGMPQPVVKSYIRQLCRALVLCHQKQIVHRDVKPENLLVAGKPGVLDDNETNLKLCDFGVARKISPSDNRLTGYVSTRWYRAPELLNSAQLQPAARGHGLVRRRVQAKWTRYTDMVDMWAVGCVMAELLTSRPLFPGSSAVDQLDLIRKYGGIGVGANPNGRSILRERLKTKICPKGFDFICKLLDMTPTNRLSASQSVAHPYLQDAARQKARVARRVVGNDGEIEDEIDEDIVGQTQQHRPEDSGVEASYHDDNFESDCNSEVDEIADSVRSGAALASMSESNKQHASTSLAQSKTQGIAVQKHQQSPPIAGRQKKLAPVLTASIKMPPLPVPGSMSGGQGRRNSNNLPSPTGSPVRTLPHLKHAPPAPVEIASARSKARRDDQSTHRSEYSHRSSRRKTDASSNVGSHKSRQKPKRSERGRQRHREGHREGGGRKEGRRRRAKPKRGNSRLPPVARGSKPRRQRGRSGVSKGRGGSKGPRLRGRQGAEGRRHPHEEKQNNHRRKGAVPPPRDAGRFGPLPSLAPKGGAALEPTAGYERKARRKKVVVRKEGHARRKKRGRKLRQRGLR